MTSYVAKFEDSISIDSMYSYELEGRQAATRYLMRETPAEPQMWCFLYSKKIAWMNSRTKRFSVPFSTKAFKDKTVLKYCRRPPNLQSLTLLEWLHKYDTNAAVPKLYKQGSTLVGTKIVSVFNTQYFFQYVLLHVCHRQFSDLISPEHDHLPEQLQWYVAAVHHFPETWENEDRIKSFVALQGHKDNYVATIVFYVNSLHDLHYLWKIKVFNSSQIAPCTTEKGDCIDLDPWQLP